MVTNSGRPLWWVVCRGVLRQSRQKLVAPVCRASRRRPTNPTADPEMAESRGAGGRHMVEPGDRYPARLGGITATCKHISALRFRPVGERLAPEMGARRGDCHTLCGRHRFGLSVSDGRRPLPGKPRGADEEVRTGAPPRQDAPDRVRAVRRTKPEKERGRKA